MSMECETTKRAGFSHIFSSIPDSHQPVLERRRRTLRTQTHRNRDRPVRQRHLADEQREVAHRDEQHQRLDVVGLLEAVEGVLLQAQGVNDVEIAAECGDECLPGVTLSESAGGGVGEAPEGG